MSTDTASTSTVERLREVLAEQGVTDTPTWDPIVTPDARPVVEVRLRSTRTRRAMLADLPDEQRTKREREAATFGIALDALDEITVRLHGVVDRRTDRADPGRWTSTSGPIDRLPYDTWLERQVEEHIPDGYVPVPWGETDALITRAVVAKAALDEGPTRLREAVTAALDAGVPGTRLARELGVSSQRIYQLRLPRDGKR